MIPTATSPSSVNHVHTSTISSSNSFNPSGISSIFSYSLQSKTDIWLLDFGANEHIVSSTHWFTSYHKITPKLVNLPNGSSVLVEYAGTIQFTPHFYLNGVKMVHLNMMKVRFLLVEYLPSFTLNLISISKLCASLKCFLTFRNDKCFLQDIQS